MTDKNYAVFILTHGRANNVITYKSLLRHGYTGKIYIVIDDQDKQADLYKEIYGDDVLIFSKAEEKKDCDCCDNFGRMDVILYPRNACFKLAKMLGLDYFIALDDDYKAFIYKTKADGVLKEIGIKNLDKIFEIMIGFYEKVPKCLSIAMAQNGDFIGGRESKNSDIQLLRKCMNTFILSPNRPFKFAGTLNEDVNLYTEHGKTGHLFFTNTFISIIQKQTQKNPGGLSDIYISVGTYVKSFYSVMVNPAFVKIKPMGDKYIRLHHEVKWNNAVPEDNQGKLEEIMAKHKLDNAMTQTLFENISHGIPIKYAVSLVGIDNATYYRWMNEAEAVIKELEQNEREPELELEILLCNFYDSMKKARAEFIKRNVANIHRHAKHTWQCSAWILERMDPENFGRKMTLEGNTDKPVGIKVDGLTEAIQDVIQMIDNYQPKSDKK